MAKTIREVLAETFGPIDEFMAVPAYDHFWPDGSEPLDHFLVQAGTQYHYGYILTFGYLGYAVEVEHSWPVMA